MAIPNAQNQYLKTQVETASKEQLVVMLFDGILRFTEQAKKTIDNNDIENTHHLLMRAQAIVMELIYTLDKEKGGEVGKNLLNLHAYAFNCLITANLRRDKAKIEEVQHIYRELREGWIGAMESLGLSARGNHQTQAKPAVEAEPAVQDRPAAKTNPYGMASSAAVPPPAQSDTLPRIPAQPQPAGRQPLGYGMGKTAMVAPASPAAQPAASGKDNVVLSSRPAPAQRSAALNAYATPGMA